MHPKFLYAMLYAGYAAGVPLSIRALQATSDTGCDTTPDSQSSTGEAAVVNNCKYNVYVQSVAGTDIDDIVTLEPGHSYSEDYRTGPNGAGVAIKITNNIADWSTPMLLEYTPNSALDMVFYDMSVSVGGIEQGTGGIGDLYNLMPSVLDPAVGCVSVNYTASYLHLGESDAATKSCPLSTNLTLSLC